MYSIALLLSSLFSLTAAFFRLAITPIKTVPEPGASGGTLGAMPDAGSVIQLFGQLKQNGAPTYGNWNLSSKAGTTNTWDAASMVGGLIKRFGSQSAADLTDTAANIVGAIPGAVVGQTFPLIVANLSSVGIITPVAGTGVTLLGTTTINRLTARMYMGRVLGSAAVTLEGGFTFPNAGID